MTRLWIMAGALALALAAAAPVARGVQSPADQLQPYLRALELVPSQKLLDAVAGGAADGTLREIAADPGRPADARVKAFVALGEYPGGANQTFLTAQVEELLPSTAGVQVLYLRAAARSLGRVGGSAVVGQLGALLDHPVPDVRADGATALALTASDTALPVLRAHLLTEAHPLAHLALVEAIRALTRQ